MLQRVFFAGTSEEVGHHAAPLAERMAVTLADPGEIVTAAQPGDLVLFFSEHFDRFRNACRQLSEKNVAPLYLVDGILEWNNAWVNSPEEPACPYTMRPVLSHKVACIGASQARVIASWGNADKVEVIGIPRFEVLQQIEKAPPETDRFRLLIMTAKCPAFTEDQRKRVTQSLRDLKLWIEKKPTLAGKRIEVCWRLTGNLEQALDDAVAECDSLQRRLTSLEQEHKDAAEKHAAKVNHARSARNGARNFIPQARRVLLEHWLPATMTSHAGVSAKQHARSSSTTHVRTPVARRNKIGGLAVCQSEMNEVVLRD